MYKPGTQLIMNQLWAADAAARIGFEVETNEPGWGWVKEFFFWKKNLEHDRPRAWCITVTKSGPNAAERFLPQVGDLIESSAGSHFIVDEPARSGDPVWVGNRYQRGTHSPFVECRRIIERNGTPFPQFSEVIEPYFRNSQR